jgi:single-stranded DNA-binding protein
MKISQSLSGFVASTPVLSRTDTGEARLYMRVGQEHYTRNDDGSFTPGETTFHDLVAFRKTAERAAQQFTKGDRFIAEGYTNDYMWADDQGREVQREQFVARKIGHDLAYTNYQIDRTERAQKPQQAPAGAEPAPTQTPQPAAIGM